MNKTLAITVLLISFVIPISARSQSAPVSASPDARQEQTLPTKLTLAEAIRTAMEQHPSLIRAREAINAANARTKQAKAGYFPQISASAVAKKGLSGATGALGLRGLVTSPLFQDIGASSGLFQNIYDFGRTAHQVNASKWATVSLEHALEAQRQLVTLNVQRAYVNALEQQRLVKVAETILAERQLIARQAGAFYKAEIKSKVDLTLAEVGVSNANLELVEARERLKEAFAEINYAMGIEGEPVYTLEEPTINVESPPVLELLISESQNQRPDLMAIDAQIKVDEEVVARSKSNKFPKVMGLLSGGILRFSELTPERLLLAAIGFDWPIFTGGRIENEIAEAKANLAQTQAARVELSQNIRFQVQRAYSDLLNSIEAIHANEQLIAQAREALRLSQIRYKVQLGSFVELISAEAVANKAEAQYAEALYAYKLNLALLNYAVGRQ